MNAPGPKRLYEARRETGEVVFDAAQERALSALDALWHQLVEPQPLSFLNRLTGKKNAPQSVYLWGGVGRGKTMMMDMFYQSLPVDFAKGRWHFHAFMLAVHDYLHQSQKNGGAKALDDVLISCADHFASTLKILCFDELVVRDVADAMLLSRLFERMLERGTAIVFTSNSAPNLLYEGGWQRERFLPFIALIEKTMTVIEVNGTRDYRTRNLDSRDLYIVAKPSEANDRLHEDFIKLVGDAAWIPLVMLVKGHHVEVPRAGGKVAWFGFKDLCAKPYAAIDYLALCERFETFLIEDIPVLTDTQRNEVKRFIALIDSLYDTRRRLIVAAAADPGDLYVGSDHAQEFERTKSRLKEMRTQAYWDEDRS